jgi:TolA-binding protein
VISLAHAIFSMRGDISMANPGEQGGAGRAPTDPVPEFRGRDTHGAGDVPPVKVDMGLGPPPARKPAPRPAGTGATAVVISAILSTLCGGAGAWAYERYLAPRAEKLAAESRATDRDAETPKQLARLEDRINGLSDQYKDVQARLESVAKSSSAPEVASLEQKVARVDGLSQQVEAIGNKLGPITQQLAQSQQKLSDLDGKLGEIRREMKETTTARERTAASPSRDDGASRTPTPAQRDGGEEASPAAEKGESSDSTYEAGVRQFRNKQYRDAYVTFRRLVQSRPDDARNWYYAALSYGLANGDWGRDTQIMAEQGADREKAGKPPKPEIDAAFAGLTKETGKEWLDFYRQPAR